MPTLKDTVTQLRTSPHTYSADLSAVAEFIDALTPTFTDSRSDVYIHEGVIELHNHSGYPIGQLIWDGVSESFVFVTADATFEGVG